MCLILNFLAHVTPSDSMLMAYSYLLFSTSPETRLCSEVYLPIFAQCLSPLIFDTRFR